MWTQQTTLSLISDLHANPCLWDVKCEDYKSRSKKLDAMEYLARKYEVKTLEVEKKIQALKNQFRREYRKMLDFKYKGSQPNGVCWFGYEPLLFLLQNYRSRQSSGTLDDDVAAQAQDFSEKIEAAASEYDDKQDDDTYDYEHEPHAPDFCSIELQQSNGATSKETTVTVSPNLSSNEITTTKQSESSANEANELSNLLANLPKRDEFSVYGEHIANRLRQSGRSGIEIAIAQHEIDNICFKLSMGTYYQLARSSLQPAILSHLNLRTADILPHLSVLSQETHHISGT